MNVWLLASLVPQCVAVGWCLWLWRRHGHLGLLVGAGLLLLMGARRFVALVEDAQGKPLFQYSGTVVWSEMIALAVSLLCLGMVWAFRHDLKQGARVNDRLRALSEELAQSEALFKTIADTTPALLWLADKNGQCQFFNKAWLEFRGESMEHEMAGGWSEAIHPEDRDGAVAKYQEHVRTRTSFEMRYRLLRKDGVYRTVLDNWFPRSGPDGEFAGFAGSCTDVTEMVESARRLEAQEDQLRRLVQGSNAILWEYDPATNAFTFVSDHAQALMGYPVEEWCRPGFWQRTLHDEDRDRAIHYCLARTSEGLDHEMDYRMVAADGRLVWIRDIISVIKDNGAPLLRGVMIDVTALYAARRALEESEARYRRVVDSSPDAVAIHEGGKVVFVNATGLKLLGARSVDEVIGRPFLDFVEASQRDSAVERAKMVIDRNVELPLTERRLLRLDGTVVDTELLAAPCMHGGKPAVMVFARDISDRKKAEALLRESEQRLALLVKQSPIGAILWDTEFRVVEWNHAAAQIFGHEAHEAVGRHARFIIPPDIRPMIDTIWKELVQNRGGRRSVNQNLTRDGRLIDCEWHNSPLIDGDGKVLGVASLVMDVTERERAQDRQQRMMLELDHRVKNNMAVVLSLVEQSLGTCTDAREFGKSFAQRVRALARTHALLASTRWQGADLHELIEQTLEAYAVGDSRRLTVGGPAVRLSVRAATPLALTVHELATNAAKYGALSVPGGSVAVHWSIEDSEHESPRLALEWVESGGPLVVEPSRRGFGRGLIENAIPYELGGRVDMRYDRAGVICRIEFPLLHAQDDAAEPVAADSAPITEGAEP